MDHATHAKIIGIITTTTSDNLATQLSALEAILTSLPKDTIDSSFPYRKPEKLTAVPASILEVAIDSIFDKYNADFNIQDGAGNTCAHAALEQRNHGLIPDLHYFGCGLNRANKGLDAGGRPAHTL